MNKYGISFNFDNYFGFFNRLLMIGICGWIISPYLNFKLGFTLYVLIFAAWFLLTDYLWIFQRLSGDLLLFVVWILTLMPYLLTGNFLYGEVPMKTVLISIFLFFSGMFMNHYYMYYKKDISALGKIAFFAIFFYLFASIQSSIGLKQYPLAARALATGIDPLQGVYSSLGIGGFGFVYSAVFVNIVLLYFILKKQPNTHNFYRYLCLIAFCVIFTMLLASSYATSLLFIIMGTIFVIFIKGKKSLLFSIILSFFFFVIFPKELIGYFLIDVALLFENNTVISTKFMDLAQGFVSDSVGSQTAARSQLYLVSLKTFLQNPFFGIYGPFGGSFNAKVGGHSGWLDLLAYYGLFGAIPLFGAIILNFRKHLRYYTGHPYYKFLVTAQILIVIFGFINPIIYVYQIGFVYFVIVPVLPFLVNAFSRKEKKELSNESTLGDECSITRGKFADRA